MRAKIIFVIIYCTLNLSSNITVSLYHKMTRVATNNFQHVGENPLIDLSAYTSRLHKRSTVFPNRLIHTHSMNEIKAV